MNIRCGHCGHRHETVAAVRACSAPRSPARPSPESMEDVMEASLDRNEAGLERRTGNRRDAPTLAEAQAYGRRTGRCMICGRKLTHPESVAAGIGPTCRQRLGLIRRGGLAQTGPHVVPEVVPIEQVGVPPADGDPGREVRPALTPPVQPGKINP